MAVKVFQVELSDARADEVNAAGSWSKVAWGKTYMDLTMGFEEDAAKIESTVFAGMAFQLIKYTKTIQTDDRNEAFEIGNYMGDQSKMAVLMPSKSVSVGDIMVMDDGSAWMVARFGFTQLSSTVASMLLEYTV